ncbi:hypothetical protein [Blastomonas sp. AAP53]|uniref:hypothetical protein n=1 Tax=Blastomonas sp. AAP53 TaxID=1248760 RepID=UPI0002E7C337|nr:hypothetical protein [Blastomonas sp. AAP53]
MSEDGPMPFGDWPAPRVSTLKIAAQTLEIAGLIEAAGWPVAADGDDRLTQANIIALDWRADVPSDAGLAHLPLDCGLLVLVSLDTIDSADAVLQGYCARCVFDATPGPVAVELAELAALVTGRTASDPHSGERARLQAMAAELARLAEQLGSLSSDIMTGNPDDTLAEQTLAYRAEAALDRTPATPPDPQRIRHLISMRRLRDRFFNADLFADPAWDILLDLSASRLEGRSVSVSSLCIAASVPPTTALRWIRMMTDQNLLVRRADAADARRMFVDISDAAFDQVAGWFAMADARGGLGV